MCKGLNRSCCRNVMLNNIRLDMKVKWIEEKISQKQFGSCDDEPAAVELMHRFMEEQGYALDITDQRLYHEIYLSDARKVAPERLKTVIRHPVREV